MGLRLPWRITDKALFLQRLRRALASAGMDGQAARYLARDMQDELQELGTVMRLIPGSEIGRTDSDILRVDVITYNLQVEVEPAQWGPDGEMLEPPEIDDRGLHADVCLTSRTINPATLGPVFSGHMRKLGRRKLAVPAKLLSKGWREVEVPTDDDGTSLFVEPLAVPRRYYAGVDPEPVPPPVIEEV